jgi:hypothetical protein
MLQNIWDLRPPVSVEVNMNTTDTLPPTLSDARILPGNLPTCPGSLRRQPTADRFGLPEGAFSVIGSYQKWQRDSTNIVELL